MTNNSIYEAGYEAGHTVGREGKEEPMDDFEMSSKKDDYKYGYINGYVSGLNERIGGTTPYEHQALTTGELLRQYGLSNEKTVTEFCTRYGLKKPDVMKGVQGNDDYDYDDD